MRQTGLMLSEDMILLCKHIELAIQYEPLVHALYRQKISHTEDAQLHNQQLSQEATFLS